MLKKITKLILPIFILLLFSINVYADDLFTWSYIAPMSDDKNELSTVSLNGKMYAIGGISSKTIEEYDPSTNTWTTKVSLPLLRYRSQAVALNGKIYIIGGMSGTEHATATATNAVLEYDPLTNTLTPKASMSVKRSDHKAEVINGKIYIVGGSGPDSTSLLRSVEEYNPQTDTWTTKASMSSQKYFFQTEVVNGKIYAIGGYSSRTIEEYDPQKDIWTTKASLPRDTDRFQSVVMNGKIYIIGGYYVKNLEEYDPQTNTITSKSSMSIYRWNFQAEAVNGKIYAIGGYSSTLQPDNRVEEYDPQTNIWTTKAPMSDPRHDFQAEVLNGKIYAIGGASNINLKTAEVCKVMDIPSAPTNLIATAGDSKVTLTWSSTTDALGYNIKRSTTSGGPYTTLASNITGTTYTDITVTNGTNYYYVVTALTNSAESDNSNEASATPKSIDVSLSVESVDKAKINDEITVDIVIHNANTICAEDLKINYDTNLLEYIGAVNADGMKIYKEGDISAGLKRYIVASLGKANAANGDKVLLKLKFKAKKAGLAKVDIVKGRIADNATLEMDVIDENCGEKSILIEGVKDVNRSGEFTLLDLGIDAYYYGDLASATDTTKYDADVVLDGTINDADLTLITQQILENKNYPANS